MPRGASPRFWKCPTRRRRRSRKRGWRKSSRWRPRKSLVNYGFYIGATADNLDELKRATRTPGIKIFIGSSTGDLLVDDQEALERIFAETTLPITAHCEDEATVRANAARLAGTHDVADHSRIRDHAAAIIATRRAIDLAYRHRHRFHVLHVSTADETELFGRSSRAHHGRGLPAPSAAQRRRLRAAGHAGADESVAQNRATTTPALWQALVDGRIQVIATDHAPHTLEEKQQPYPESPSGVPAVENSLALMLNEVHRGRCTLRASRALDVRCPGPRVGHRRQGPHRRRLRRRPGAGRSGTRSRSPQRRAAHQVRLEPLARRDAHRLAGANLGDGPRSVSRRSSSTTNDAAQEAVFDHARGGYWATS